MTNASAHQVAGWRIPTPCDGCGSSGRDGMIIRAGDKQINLCGSCVAQIDDNDGWAQDIEYLAQLHAEEEA